MTPAKLRPRNLLQGLPSSKDSAFGSGRVNPSKIKDCIKLLYPFWSQSRYQSQISPENTQIAITRKQDTLSLDYIQDLSRVSKNKAPRILKKAEPGGTP